MQLEFGYGSSVQTVNVPEENLIATLRANPVKHEHPGREAVKYALENPIGEVRLKEYVKPGQKIAIITSDISRPVPSYEILPDVLDELYAGGIKKEDITVLLALGSHRQHTDEERKKLVGERCYSEVKVADSNPAACIQIGTTKHGTPASFDPVAVNADVRVCIGNIEYHYFAGYSGGYKALMPGVSTPEAIQVNHTMLTRPEARTANIDSPVRRDIEEAAAMLGPTYIVNVVLDEHKHIIYGVSGDPIKAHRAGCAYLDSMYLCKIPEKADIVIVSQGGKPKDANLYQTQKALDNSKHAVKDGGTIILIGECPEGFGNQRFETWMKEAKSPHEVVERIERDFQLGGHKAASIAQVEEKAEIMLVSSIDDDTVKNIFMTPVHSAQEAFDLAIKKHGKDAKVIAMPFGGATLPTIEK